MDKLSPPRLAFTSSKSPGFEHRIHQNLKYRAAWRHYRALRVGVKLVAFTHNDLSLLVSLAA